jgi:hypothetical protein
VGQRNALPLHGTFMGSASSFRGMDVEVSVIEEKASLTGSSHNKMRATRI